MAYENTLPERVPEKGFYYHYKHDPAGSVNNYAYEFIGVGHHTEDDCRPEDANMAVYRPLYDSFLFKNGKLFDLRPLEMWMGTIEKDGQAVSRFTKITDKQVIADLMQVRKEMYGS